MHKLKLSRACHNPIYGVSKIWKFVAVCCSNPSALTPSVQSIHSNSLDAVDITLFHSVQIVYNNTLNLLETRNMS